MDKYKRNSTSAKYGDTNELTYRIEAQLACAHEQKLILYCSCIRTTTPASLFVFAVQPSDSVTKQAAAAVSCSS